MSPAFAPGLHFVLTNAVIARMMISRYVNIRKQGGRFVPELYLPPRGEFGVRISPALAMVLTLPLAELGPKFPGLDQWLMQLPGRLGRAVRADVRLLCVPLSGALSYLIGAKDDEESLQPALDALRAATPAEVQDRVVRSLASHGGDVEPAELMRWVHEEPTRVRELILSMDRPSPDESFPVDVDRAVALLAEPTKLKELVELRLSQLWHDHVGPRWREVLPTTRALAQAARSQFHLGDPDRVLNAVIGRGMHDQKERFHGNKLVFAPVPFLGPYVSIASGEPGSRRVYIGFGIAHGADGVDEATPRDLLAALGALADEARLNAVAHIREHGQACAADLMARFGWSQPATSRHLRALESTGLLDVERVDGVKWYTIGKGRARAIVRSLEQFLTGE